MNYLGSKQNQCNYHSAKEEQIIIYLDSFGINQLTDPEDKQQDFFQKRRNSIAISISDSQSPPVDETHISIIDQQQPLEIVRKVSLIQMTSPLLIRRFRKTSNNETSCGTYMI